MIISSTFSSDRPVPGTPGPLPVLQTRPQKPRWNIHGRVDLMMFYAQHITESLLTPYLHSVIQWLRTGVCALTKV